ncbi:NAC domain-containing protein 35 [Dichanthelium oligosanthes]|uniref:NAC domain-containing protein 35 n=1 Tax=Dichanthelium oligosanthes TaxID=888268 RepID=A0A1E5VRV7_9POAL|nr:NAC domain-containing protein 35 [Dichanthelium oligosanthes]
MERRSASSGGGGCGAAELELPGFRFHPTEEELLEFYLKQVAHGKKLKFDIIPTVHLYRHDPWELPGLARIGEREWYFFVPRDRKQAGGGGCGGGRPSRTTERGFWKATGSDRAVRCANDPKRLIGLKKTLVYYEGRAPRGTKTDWVMNEYRLPDGAADSSSSGSSAAHKEDIVLCKIYRKAVSLKELEQRVAMEELARASATPSASHNTGSPADSVSSSDQDAVVHQHQQGDISMMMGIPPASICMKKEVLAESSTPAVLRPATLSLPQLDVAKQPAQQQEWMQDPFLTQLRSPWMESWSPYFASSVLNF